jgi:glutamyl-tRNA synthetase
MRGRFAPSPTGDLHLGNARTALLAWASARARGGAFVLRVEDLDPPRTVARAVDGNLAELRWLGLDWDEGPDVGGPFAPYRQSERGAHYDAALARLATAGLLAECYLSRRDIALASSAPHGPSGPVYGPRQRAASERLAPQRRAAGREPSLRFRPPDVPVSFRDAGRGERVVDPATEVGDVVVRRADGLYAYALAVAVDDAAMAITEVVRGDDLLDATAPQVLLARALGHEPPEYRHVPLLLDAAGARMAKRTGGATLRALMEGGADAARVRGALLAGAGLLDAPRPLASADVPALFDPARLVPAAARWTEAMDAWTREGARR